MKAKLLGVRRLDIEVNEKIKDPINGCKLFFSYHDADPKIKGDLCDSRYVSDEKSEILLIDPNDYIGETIELDFDTKGKLQCVSA